MYNSIILQSRDKILLDEVKLFGFTTIEHFIYRFSTSIDIAYYVFSRLVRKNFLKPAGVLNDTNKKFYIPDLNFYSVIKAKDTVRLSLASLEHDEYLLKLYSAIKSKNFDLELKLEQEFKKNNEYKNISKIPDLFISTSGANYIVEYEKSEKSYKVLEQIKKAYDARENKDTCFVFICETSNIAKKLKTVFDFKYQLFLKPKALLDCFKNKKCDSLIKYLNEKNLRYF